ncbi:MAG: hypothetical protein OXI24_15760 [Candidatus Poribacteria bacterium]|nr:hypothetical protein [Candidatus Poribacteria bacterium]
MSKTYKYAGKSLTERIARELVIEIFSGKMDIEKREIRQKVDEIHTSRGGRLSTNEIHPVSTALSIMKKQRLANNPSWGRWSIFSHAEGERPFNSDTAQTLGSGENAVYLYYYPAYRCLAEYEGKESWACKIDRVGLQVPVTMPEVPEVRLIFRTDDSENLEQTLHNILRLRGKHIEDTPDGSWFLTSPSEVEKIYKNAVGMGS